MRKTILVFGSVLKDGETCDSARVRAETGPAAMLMLHNAMEARDYGNLAGGKAPPTPVNSPFGQLEREYRASMKPITRPTPVSDVAPGPSDVRAARGGARKFSPTYFHQHVATT